MFDPILLKLVVLVLTMIVHCVIERAQGTSLVKFEGGTAKCK